MDRFFIGCGQRPRQGAGRWPGRALVAALALAALMAGARARQAEPVFFSMLFPQLTPGARQATAGEAAYL